METKIKFVLIFSIFIILLIGVGFILGYNIKKEKIITIRDTQVLTTTIVREVQPVPQPVNCIKGESYFYIEELGSLIKFGETEICGVNLYTGNTVGPSYDEKINNLEEELSRWKDCALYQSCSKEMLSEKR